MSQALTVLSQVVGWLYFFCWSISFYPQLYVTYRLKQCATDSIEGYSVDYSVLNWTGFLAYSVYNLVGYIDPSSMPGQVDISDVVFALHAWVLVNITIAQCQCYGVIRTQNVWRRTHWFSKATKVTLWLLAFLFLGLQRAGALTASHDFSDIIWFGYMKITITLMKYCPQVYKNWERKSTTGWSMENVVLDFMGGFLSIVQIFIDGANTGDWNVFAGGGSFNIAKFCLGFTSMVFDVIFMVQHWALYLPGKQGKTASQTALKLLAEDQVCTFQYGTLI